MATEERFRVTERARSIQRSTIREMFELAEDYEGDAVRLEVGEPDFTTPEHIIEAATEGAKRGETHYTSTAGTPEVREAIAEKSAREHDLEFDPETEVAATAGAMEAILLSLLAVADAGDEVVVPTPAWPNYVLQAKLIDAEAVEVGLPPDRDFAFDADRIVNAMSEDTAAVVINTPSNPVGRTHDIDAIAEVVDAAADYGAYVLADEVYKTLSFDGDPTSIAAALDDPEHVLTINSTSKQYAMTGWRLGWVIAPEYIIDEVMKLHAGTSTNASSVSQRAAIAAMRGPQGPVEEMYDAFRERRDYVVERVADLPAIDCPRPEGAFYAFLDVRDLPGGSFDIARRLLDEYGVVTVPGEGFGAGGEGFLRVSFATGLDRLEEGFDRMERFVADELG